MRRAIDEITHSFLTVVHRTAVFFPRWYFGKEDSGRRAARCKEIGAAHEDRAEAHGKARTGES